MNEEEVKQIEKDKQRVQEQIAWEAMLFVVFAFLLGYSIKLVPNIIPQGFFTILSGLIAWALVEKRIKYSVDLVLEKIEGLLKKKFDINRTQEDQKKDFMSLVKEELGFDKILSEPFIIKEPDFRGKLEENELEKRLIKFQKSLKCINELLFYYDDDNGKKIELLKGIVISAVEESILIDKQNPKFPDICKHLYAYLRAWLICSIRYNTSNLPIEWIQDTILSKQQQVTAIKYIKDNILPKMPLNEETKQYISDDSIEETRKYLEILIEKIKVSVK
jgi:hypothetical protein